MADETKSGITKKKKIEIESNISPKALFEKMGSSGGTGSGEKNIEREKKYWAKKKKKNYTNQ